MEPSGQVSSGLDGELDGENCLKEIANNYVEDEDIDNSSGDEIGVARENGIPFSQDTEGRHVLAKNGTEDYRGNDSASEGVRNNVSDDSSGDEDSGEESSGKDEEQDGDDEDDEGEEEAVKDIEGPEGNYGSAALGRGEPDNVFVNKSSREHGKLVGNERYSAAGEGFSIENEEVDNAHGIENGLQVPEKSQTESESGPHVGGAQGGPALRRRRGRPLKSSDRKSNVRAAPITPKLEEPRVVRVNRGVKRRFPEDLRYSYSGNFEYMFHRRESPPSSWEDAGDESEDSLPKRIRVRSIASVCGDFSQQVKGEDLSMDESHEITPARKRGRPRKSDGGHGGSKADEAETLPLPSTGKRKMVEAVLDSDNLKRSCNTRNGPIYACNAEGCKKRFEEAADLYVHARVHGDRPYVCHYEGCVKSFSERSKLKRHFLIHTGEKPFLCMYEGCGKAFSLDFNLRSHMKTHTGDYHECPYDGCDKRYCQEYKLRAHVAKEHSKPVRGAKKATKAVGKNVRGANGSKAGDLAAAKKRDTLSALYQKRLKLEQIKEDRVTRIAELEDEKRREASELVRVEQELKKIERELRQLEGHAGSSAPSLSEEEDEAEDEEEEEEEEEEAGDPSPSNGTAGDTSSSGEQQSRLEYTAMGDGKDVVMFAHKLPTADQGARLVKTMGGRHADWSVKTMGGRPAELQQEQTTSITPHLWLQGHPPHHGHLAQHLGARPALRSRRPTAPPVMAKPSSSSGEKDRTVQQKRINGEMWSQGESSDSGMGRPNGGAQKLSGGSAEGKSRAANTFKKNLVAAGRGTPKPNTSRETPILSIEGENGKVDQKPQKRITAVDQAKAPKQQIGRPPSSEPPVFVSMNPILFSTDHRFSPTDARFLATEGILAQGSLRDRLQVKEVVKTFPGQSCVPKEKSYRSMNEVLHSSTDQGYSACSGLNDGLLIDQAPSEQSFEPSAAQLFTYHEQPRLED